MASVRISPGGELNVELGNVDELHIRDDARGARLMAKLKWEGYEIKLIVQKERDLAQKLKRKIEELARVKEKGVKRLKEQTEGFVKLVNECDGILVEQYEQIDELCRKLMVEQEERDKTEMEMGQQIQDERRKNRDILEKYKASLSVKKETYVLQLKENSTFGFEAKREVLGQLDEPVLQELGHRLFNDFNVRLVGIDSGLNFLFEVPEDGAKPFSNSDFQRKLAELLPSRVPDDARWSEAKSLGFVDVSELLIGEPIPDWVRELAPDFFELIFRPPATVIGAIVAGSNGIRAVSNWFNERRAWLPWNRWARNRNNN